MSSKLHDGCSLTIVFGLEMRWWWIFNFPFKLQEREGVKVNEYWGDVVWSWQYFQLKIILVCSIKNLSRKINKPKHVLTVINLYFYSKLVALVSYLFTLNSQINILSIIFSWCLSQLAFVFLCWLGLCFFTLHLFFLGPFFDF